MLPFHLDRSFARYSREGREHFEYGTSLVGMHMRFPLGQRLERTADQEIDTRLRRNFRHLPGLLANGLLLGGDDLCLFFNRGLPLLGLRLGALYIDQSEGNFLPVTAFHAVVSDPVGLDLVLANQVIIPVLQVQFHIRRKCGEGEKEGQISRESHTLMITTARGRACKTSTPRA